MNKTQEFFDSLICWNEEAKKNTRPIDLNDDNIRPKFIIDVDDVLRATTPKMLELYNNEFGTSLERRDLTEYDVNKSYPLIKERLGIDASEWFFNLKQDELFGEAQPLPGAKYAVDILSEYGHIIICTHQRTPMNKKITAEWLDKHHFNYDGVFFTQKKYLITGDFVIDDCIDYFKYSNSKTGILINMPFNEQFDEEEFRLNYTRCRELKRCNSILEFALQYKEESEEWIK